MINPLENSTIKLPDNVEKHGLIKDRMRAAAGYIKDVENIQKKFMTKIVDSKSTQAYMDLVVFSELFLNGKINIRELYKELVDEEIITNNRTFDNYQRTCNDLRYSYRD